MLAVFCMGGGGKGRERKGREGKGREEGEGRGCWWICEWGSEGSMACGKDNGDLVAPGLTWEFRELFSFL